MMKEKRVSLDKNQVDSTLQALLSREMTPILMAEMYNIISLLRSAQPIIEEDEVFQ